MAGRPNKKNIIFIKKLNIDTDVPIPEARTTWSHLLEEMEEGDSVLLKTKAQVAALWQAAKREGIEVLSETEDKGIRIWRVK